MKAKHVIILGSIIAIVGGAYLYYKKQYKKLMDYTIKLSGIRFVKISKELVQLELMIRYGNKSNLEATVKRVYGEVYVRGKNVGFFNEVKPFVIPIKGENDVPISFSFSPEKITDNAAAFALELGIKKDIPIQVKGYTTVVIHGTTLNVPYDYNTTMKEYMLGADGDCGCGCK